MGERAIFIFFLDKTRANSSLMGTVIGRGGVIGMPLVWGSFPPVEESTTPEIELSVYGIG